jgi:hypothetical protein
MTIDVDRLYIDLVRPGLNACFLTVSPDLLVLTHEPTSVQRPLIYSLLDRRDTGPVSQLLPITYRTYHALLIPYQDPAGAEALAMQWADAIPNSVLASREFELAAGVEAIINPGDGRSGGSAQIPEAQLGWAMVGAAKCRVIEFYSTVLVKIDTQLVRPR